MFPSNSASPDPSDRTTPPPLEESRRADEWAEREAARRVLNVWSIPPGRRPWLTLSLVIGSALVTAFSKLQPELAYAWFYASGSEIWADRKWWGILGSVFLHGDLLHLVFNAYWTWLFGRLLERELGPLRYLALVLAGTVLGGAAELGWSGELGVGLSGVVYAFFGFLLVSRSRHPDFRRVLPRGTQVLMLVWLAFCFVLTWAQVMLIANFAHLGGFVIGLLAGLSSAARRGAALARAGCAIMAAAALTVLCWAPWQEAWQSADAYRALVANDDARALVALEKVRAKNPANLWALRQEAHLRARRGEFSLHRQLMEEVFKHDPTAVELNNLAWLLATSPDDAVRDGEEAVRLARRACSLDDWQQGAYIDTLAAAHAETGDFEEAEKRLLEAMRRDQTHTAIYEQHLRAFRARQAWRETPAPVAQAQAK